MDNFDDFEKKSYREYKKQYGLADHAAYFYSMLKFSLTAVLILIKEVFSNLFNPPPRKNLSGQLALVTGKN
jgi:hypothetical protein